MPEQPTTRSIFAAAFLRMTPLKRVIFLIVGFGTAYAALVNLFIAATHGEITVPASDGLIVSAAGDPTRFNISIVAWAVLLLLALAVAGFAMLGDRAPALIRAWRESRKQR
jgi:hypothetical protein